ncbi:sugar transferase [Nocardioides sp. Arc9.136]|uniref:sugar transferase n=1 Tax=Nocardioides sp. Arc9.136 TaxID=2996826 RepID=UPI0026652B81|nr:sugar transferase [Nocardioides sp. Arc9.136]WKN48039.1 sugar transferase [Nocardioides sp. Arc9.136]
MTIATERRWRLGRDVRSRSLRYLPLTTLVLDLALIVVAVVLAALGRESFGIFPSPADVSENLSTAGPLVVLGWLAMLVTAGAYGASAFGAGTEEYKRVLNGSLGAAGLVGVGCFFADYPLSRGFYFLSFAIGIPALLLGRFVVRSVLHQARRRGNLLHRVVIAGSPAHVDEIAAVLRRESWLGYRVVGALTPAHYLEEETRSGIPVLGNSDDITAVVLDSGADVVFIAGGALGSSTQMRRLAWDLEHERVQVVVAPSVTDVSSERIRVRPVGGLPLMHIDPPRATDASRWGKRLFDLIGSSGLILVFGPLFVLAAVQIKLHDRGPVLFRQTRVGQDGREFPCLKFRTMVVDAESRLQDLHAQEGYEDGLFKMKEDPRVTRPGRWLRRLSLDELPQLFNVLRGEMSLVGPRPPLPLEVARYEGDTARRLRVRPGMTGLWQVSGRSDLSWSEAVRLDLYYVDNWSMLQDISILVKTLRAVFGSRGAY